MRASSPPDLASPEFNADPFPHFARLRAEEPVCRTVLADGTELWLVTRYGDVLSLLKDARFAKDRRAAMTAEQLRRQPWVPPMFRPLERNMLDLDPPDHTRLRALVQKAFTPRLVDGMRTRIDSLTGELLDAAVRRGEFDLIRDFALPVPVTVISEILGVPSSERNRFHRWSAAIVSLSSARGGLRAFPSVWAFVRYLRRFFRLRRAEPSDDLTTALLQAEEAGDRLSGDELTAMVFLLLVAGHETTVNLIGNGALALIENPDQKDRLVRDLSRIGPAVEELLRFTSPVFLSTERYARQDSEICDVKIPRGALTYGVIGSANRDGTVFTDPDRLDLGRENNRHLGFGHGIHYCLGAPLARLEAQTAIAALLARAPGLRLKVPAASLRWRRGLLLRGLEELPVEVR
jgi:cytochrome P450 PksS